MGGINFVQLGVLEDEEIGPKKDYVIPFTAELGKGQKEVNHLKVKNGRLFFGWSDSNCEEYRSSNNSHFLKIAKKATNRASKVRFPTAQRKKSGWHYGQPKWTFGK